MTNSNVVLINRQPIKHPNWYSCFYAEVFTLKGYCEENGDNYEEALERAQKFGHHMVGSTYGGTIITSDKSFYDRENAIAATAIVLEEGQMVEIDGVIYKTVYNQGNTGKSPKNSDPIKFVLVKG